MIKLAGYLKILRTGMNPHYGGLSLALREDRCLGIQILASGVSPSL